MVWGSILAFFCSCFSEFLIWSQLVSYWVKDAGMSMGVSTNLYAFLGVLGCILRRCWARCRISTPAESAMKRLPAAG